MNDDRFMLIDSDNNVICEGVVKDFFRTEGEFQVANGMRALNDFENGDLVRFVFQDGRKGVFEGEIVEIRKNKIFLEQIHSIAQYVKEDVRIHTNFESRIYEKRSDGQLIGRNVLIADISAGGVRILTNAPLRLQEVMELVIPYYAEYIIMDVKAIRELPYDPDKDVYQKKYSYGCQFYDLMNEEERMIRGMVFTIAARKAAKTGGRI